MPGKPRGDRDELADRMEEGLERDAAKLIDDGQAFKDDRDEDDAIMELLLLGIILQSLEPLSLLVDLLLSL